MITAGHDVATTTERVIVGGLSFLFVLPIIFLCVGLHLVGQLFALVASIRARASDGAVDSAS